ncbi:class II aldolase/adducin family protein [Clostridium sp. AWRP]|uniref:class II aldolase/adducin family protein n=1 Tax=Clostridium sp. AWRP TaxID=2212991 RepID=UPI000FD9C64C|nr:class II aldolase/adducin family protein [Clostridium sp. AWRP]AZV56520.1 class II aldolase/adducin family protein [Clostridium sp. AWRP]
MDRETYLRAQIVETGKRLQQRFFVASNDGNISVKLEDNIILITPTGVNKGEVCSDQIVKVDLDGNVIEGHMKVTSEIKMHLIVYKMRNDIKAVVHAHPPAATAFAVSGEKLDEPTILPEAIFSLGKVGYCDYGTPSTCEVSQSVEKEIPYSDALLLANHGALTVGKDVMDAYYKMENLEMVSKITLYTKIIGNVRTLNKEQIEKLNRVKKEKGWGNVKHI